MKTFFKSFAYFCSFLILFQSCTVYHKSNVTLKKAYESQKKVRIKTLDKKTLKYRHIGYENDQYLGYFKHGNKLVRIGIKEDMIKKIQIKNSKMSTILTAATLFIFITPIIVFSALGGIGPVGFPNS
jgi:hypothetical protein